MSKIFIVIQIRLYYIYVCMTSDKNFLGLQHQEVKTSISYNLETTKNE